ncbi:MAG TPA: hypothetical protein VKZ53_17050 [Candidatus Angelobacter sp.]|nr:hypothetical protein [Candidatus Angelobacter sp.]
MFVKNRGTNITLAVAAVLAALLQPSPTVAQTQPQFVEYSAKFVCGVAEGNQPGIRPGTYATSINIHNPQLPLAGTVESIIFLKKAVVSLPEGSKPIPPSRFRRDVLAADFAEEVDCKTIRSLFGISLPPFIEGYVVIIVPPSANASSQELDVQGIYTATPLNGPGIALEIVPITPRFIPAQPGASIDGKLLE